MKKLLIIIIVGLFWSCTQEVKMAESWQVKYPETRRDSVVDNYFGTSVTDPYRWLENDTAGDTEAWVKEQNKITSAFLDQIPYREKIKTRLTELFNYTRYSAPEKVGEYYFFHKNNGLQNQAVIYFQKGKKGEPKIFIDPNAISEGGTVSIELLGASEDHKYIAYSQSGAGSDWSEIHIREIDGNRELDDVLDWVKFSGAAWYKDGFYYSRYPEPVKGQELSGDNKDHSVYYHKLGTLQSEDKLFYKNEKNRNLYHNAYLTEDNKFLVMLAAAGTDGYETFIKDLEKDGPLMKLRSGFKSKTSIIDHRDGFLYAYTNVGAPNYRLVRFQLDNFEESNWENIITESDKTLVGVSTGGGYLFAEYLSEATSMVKQLDYNGQVVHTINFPAPGSAGGFSGERDDKTLFYTFTSFTYPATIFEYDLNSGESRVFNKIDLLFNPEDYVAKQVKYKSKDGTEIPMFIVHKKGVELNGQNPTVLYGYGGFNVSLSPSFSSSNIFFLENGGVYALANLRGGGEFGEAWHRAGMMENKQTVFDDFIAAAEYLISEKYTSSSKLAIKGGSNGGLLVGAAMTQRPDLFAVALPAVGVMDMLRFQNFTVGKGWVAEYGSADSSKAQFDFLHAYSPLHNLKKGTSYPATLITTGDHDDRVVPAHSFKFAATLQEAQTGDNPALIRIDTDAGHGAGKPVSKVIDEQSDIWAFTLYAMDVDSIKVQER